MFSVAKQQFGDVDVVCPGAGVYEPVSKTLSFFEQWLAHYSRRKTEKSSRQEVLLSLASS